MRLSFDGYISEDAENEDGPGDTAIGFKINVLKESGVRPEMGFLAGLTLPTGKNALSSERADPSFQFLFSNSVTERISIGYNLGMSWKTVRDGSGGGHDTLSSFEYAVSAGFKITDRFGTFAESFGNVPMSANGNPAHSFDTGFTYKVRNNIQLDASTGVGLSDDADDWFAGAGISINTPF
ncbi:MAG: transporter [Candidatus Scalindua sp.]|nr:transporter [Candidatus Scalindua sp.]